MHELASEPVGTVHVSVVLLAELGLVLGGHVLLLEKLVVAMRKRAVVPKFALSKQLPIATYLQGMD